MTNLIIGNFIALLCSLSMVYCGLIKEKKKIIYIQTIEKLFSILSNLILGGITGAIMNAVGYIRNFLCYKNKLKQKEKIILIIISIVLSLSLNNIGFIGFLPLIATVLYTLLMDTPDIVAFKKLVISTTFLWVIYELYIKSYSSAIFHITNIVSNYISIYELHIYQGKKLQESH